MNSLRSLATRAASAGSLGLAVLANLPILMLLAALATVLGSQPHVLAVSGGTVVAWGGGNEFGQTTLPAGLSGVIAIAAGSLHTMALKSDGTVAAWGYNYYGQTTVPAGLSGVIAIAAGDFHAVALKNDGTVAAWGSNVFGETTVPPGLSGVGAISAGPYQTVALKNDGTVVAWGSNSSGQTTVPFGLSGVIAIAAGAAHVVALKNDGTVVAWGRNTYGETAVPAGLSGVIAIAAGCIHSVALKNDGTVVAWGNANAGTMVPAGLSTVIAISAGLDYTVALKNDGTVVAWGLNPPTVPTGLSRVIAIAAGNGHTVALVGLPVLVFIPGISGSELRLNGTPVWPSIWAVDLQSLNLRTGTSGAIATDIVRTAYGQNLYAPFVAHLTAQGYSEFPIGGNPANMTTNFQTVAQSLGIKPTFFAFPYDWRYSNSSQTATLRQYIVNIRALHGGAKLNIVAHSMGGILARRYILDYGSDDIDHLVTVGTPVWGAPVAIYRMLAGDLYGVPLIDWFNNATVIALLPTLPGFCELLPSDHFLQNGGLPVMSEERWDIDGNRSVGVSLTAPGYKALINTKGSPDAPAHTSDLFHNYQGGVQDNWSAGNGGVSYFHICGQQNTPDTPSQVIARSETVWFFGFPIYERHYFDQVKGPGDGTVPLRSSQRFPQYLAPGTPPPWTIQGPNKDVEHSALMRNPNVWAAIDAFLANQPVPPPPAALALPPPPTGAVATQRITIVGVNYVRVVDALGNDNAKLSDMAARRIAGVPIAYGGSEPWVDISAESTVDLTIDGPATDPPLHLSVVQLAADGTALSLRRYQIAPAGHAWQGRISPASAPSVNDPVVSVDANGNGTYEAGEQIPSTHTSGTGAPDTVAPLLAMTLSTSGEAILVSLNATDAVSPSPLIRYTINDGPVQNYPGPLSVAGGQNVVVKAFAEDAMGNTSGLITTNVRPDFAANRQAGPAIGLSWPVAEAYVLEEADDLLGPWTVSPAQISRSTFNESASVPIGTTPRKFFRLRAQTVTK